MVLLPKSIRCCKLCAEGGSKNPDIAGVWVWVCMTNCRVVCNKVA